VQDTIAQMLFCVALACVLAFVAAATLSRPSRTSGRCLLLPRLVIAAGPLYLGAEYVFCQGAAVVTCAMAAFALGLYALREWWLPERLADALDRRRAAPPAAAPPALPRAGVFDFAGPQRRAALAKTALRSRMAAVIHDDRHPPAREDRSMSTAA
jgi:hypothetical protein